MAGVSVCIGCGNKNFCLNTQSCIINGFNNYSNGHYHFVAGDNNYIDGGPASLNHLVLGSNFQAHSRTYVCSINDGTAMTAFASNLFMMSCTNGMTVYTNVGNTTGVNLPSGGSAWAAVCDRNKKENLIELNYNDINLRMRNVPIYSYNYKCDKNIKNIGPMAQDWHLAFPTNKNNLTIETMDLDGVKLALIKNLAFRLDRIDKILGSE